jgi:hypothetical protein
VTSSLYGDRTRLSGRERLPWWFTVGLFVLALAASPLSGQSTEQPDLKRAIAAYEAGDMQQALDLLQAAPAFLNAHDSAVRALYMGLVRFALGDRARAHDDFLRALRTEPPIRLDPTVHSPARVAAFEEVRAELLGEWRTTARAADARHDEPEGLRLWRLVRAAEPEDAEAVGRIAAIEEAQRQSAAARQAALDSARLAAAAAAGRPDSTATVAAPRYNPGRALALGLVVPGLGQVYTGRTVRGVLALGVAAAAVAVGYMSERVDVNCATEPVNNVCPPADVLSENTKRPYLSAGVAAAVGVTLVSAIDAMLAARQANARAGSASPSAAASGVHLLAPALRVAGTEVHAEFVRLRFR